MSSSKAKGKQPIRPIILPLGPTATTTSNPSQHATSLESATSTARAETQTSLPAPPRAPTGEDKGVDKDKAIDKSKAQANDTGARPDDQESRFIQRMNWRLAVAAWLTEMEALDALPRDRSIHHILEDEPCSSKDAKTSILTPEECHLLALQTIGYCPNCPWWRIPRPGRREHGY